MSLEIQMNRRALLKAGAAAAALPFVTSARNLAATAARSQVAFDRRALQQLLDESAESLGIVGAQLAVFDGEAVHEFATGLAIRERNLAVTPDTLFQIGSTTKVFNAAVVMALVDEGTLDLDEPVASYLGGAPLTSDVPPVDMTLRQLLSMSSGLDNGPYTDHGRGDDALGRYVASLAELPAIFEPGTAYGYSNAGTAVAGYAAQRVMGRNWETLLAERILEPLGLEHSATFPEDLLYHPVALGYSPTPSNPEGERVARWGLPRSIAPAGATLCCSAGDLVRFAGMFLRGGRSADGRQVLSEEAVETMHTPEIDMPTRIMAHRWCTGPYWKRWGGDAIYGHSGTNSGGSSLLLWCPSKGVAAATIANVPSQGYPLADKVFDTLFPEVFGIDKPQTPKPDTVTPQEVELERYVGRFEAFGSRFSFRVDANRLMARSEIGGALESELIPLGGDRFLPRNPAMGGNRGWDVAFWGDDGNGRATHYLNGVFAMRRSG